MKKAIYLPIIIATLLLGGCQSQAPVSNNSGTTPTGNYTDAKINSPDLSQPLQSPATISGQISPSFVFEGVFPVELSDANGGFVAGGNAQVQTDNLNQPTVPFTVTLTFSTPTTSSGVLTLKKDNPSGLDENADSRNFPVSFTQESANNNSQNSATTPSETTPAQNNPSTNPNLKSYQDQSHHFSVQYANNFTLQPNSQTGADNPENIVATITYPDSYSTDTNLAGAKIDFEITNQQSDCTQSGYDQTSLTKTAVQNGITFNIDDWHEGAAGHDIEHLGYYTWQNQKCYKVILSMNAANLGNFDPASAPKAFDRQKIVDAFDQILSTFQLI